MAIKRALFPAEFKALGDKGKVEAIVSVFGNVDRIGDRVMPGAFKKTIAAWKESGDPVPVILSHSWDDPWAHIGVVDDLEEVDAGLKATYTLDIDTNPVAAQVHRLMKRRSLKEHSFGYEIRDERIAKDGANELLDVDLIEIGPTLKGMNPSTELLAVKSALEASPTLVISPSGGDDTKAFQDAIDSIPYDGIVVVEPGDFRISGNVIINNKGEGIAISGKSSSDVETKLYGSLVGSIEERQERISNALREAVGSENVWVWVVATYSDRVVYSRQVDGGASEYFEATYTIEGDTVTFGSPVAVDISTSVRAKALKAGRRISRATEAALAAAADEAEALAGKIRGLLSAGDSEKQDDDEQDAVKALGEEDTSIRNSTADALERNSESDFEVLTMKTRIERMRD